MSELVEYVKNGHGNRIGIVIARILSNGKIGIGWSKVNVKADDRFNKNIGWSIAYSRCGDPNDVPYHATPCIPTRVKKVRDRMVERSQKYFKQAIADPVPIVEKKKYTIIYGVSGQCGSHSYSTVHMDRVETDDLSKLVDDDKYGGNLHYIFEGWPKLEGE